MAELKTQPTKSSVTDFINTVSDEERRKDCKAVIKIMKEVTGAKPEMWGASIVGFGRHRYKYASGREGDWPVAAFSPRKNDLTLYFMPGFQDYEDLMSRLGKYKTGKSCLYLKRLADVDANVLRKLIEKSVDALADKRYR
ncbi:MAG TPA: DUF1801 domain-containing protein [Pyrinomonadaceae bacterium]|jgi:hypothetical protein